MKLTDIRKVIEEGPNCIEQFLKRGGISFSKGLSPKTEWYIDHRCYPFSIEYSGLYLVDKLLPLPQETGSSVVFTGEVFDYIKRIPMAHVNVRHDTAYDFAGFLLGVSITLPKSTRYAIYKTHPMSKLAVELGPELYQSYIGRMSKQCLS